MLEFKNTEEVNAFFEKWYDYSESTRLQIIRDLRVRGSLSMVSAKSQVSFRCPINGFLLARPCQLKQCQYFMDSPEDRNCLVSCLSQTKHGRLSAPEVAVVLSASVSDVNSVANTAVRKIRKAIIKDRIEKLVTCRFQYLSGHCVSCEAAIHDELEMNTNPELVVEYGKFGWCSLACRRDKPKWQFRIEKDYGCHYGDAITTTLGMNGATPEMVDQMFSLEPGTAVAVRNKLDL